MCCARFLLGRTASISVLMQSGKKSFLFCLLGSLVACIIVVVNALYIFWSERALSWGYPYGDDVISPVDSSGPFRLVCVFEFGCVCAHPNNLQCCSGFFYNAGTTRFSI